MKNYKYQVKLRTGNRCKSTNKVVFESNDIDEARTKMMEDSNYYIVYTTAGIKQYVKDNKGKVVPIAKKKRVMPEKFVMHKRGERKTKSQAKRSK